LLKNVKTICSHGEWTITYTSAKNAILFAYLHRAQELHDYEKYLFATTAIPVKKLLVIQLDQAIHLCITHSNDISFTS